MQISFLAGVISTNSLQPAGSFSVIDSLTM